jgi:hypothetical protein
MWLVLLIEFLQCRLSNYRYGFYISSSRSKSLQERLGHRQDKAAHSQQQLEKEKISDDSLNLSDTRSQSIATRYTRDQNASPNIMAGKQADRSIFSFSSKNDGEFIN